MKAKLEGIVTRTIKYRDTSIVTNIFTNTHGQQAYIINNIRSSRSKTSIGLFQPLTLLSFVAYQNPDKEINRISEVQCLSPYRTIHTNIKKTAISIFLAELLSKVCRTTDPDEQLFNFMKRQLIAFDERKDRFENFHLLFLMELTRFFGFRPTNFDEFSQQLGLSGSEAVRLHFSVLLKNKEPNSISSSDRKYLLDAILDFYRLHIEGFTQMSSNKILHEVLK